MTDDLVEESGPPNYYKDFCETANKNFPSLEGARNAAKRKLNDIQSYIESSNLQFSSENGIIVFGSLGRKEFTNRSDIDWTYLTNGPASNQDYEVSGAIKKIVSENETDPGGSGLFGGLTSSHDLVHNIGGIDDTNGNMTRRLLLLLESVQVAGDLCRDSVISTLLERYLIIGAGVGKLDAANLRVPRFLLNDFVRLWRTIAVDYASKKWLQDDKKWAIRNSKLRFTRKMLFMKGLLLSLDCEYADSDGDREWPWNYLDPDFFEDNPPLRLQEGITRLIELSPVDTFCRAALITGNTEQGCDVLEAYDSFISILNDDEKRKHLEKNVSFKNAEDDQVFANIRNLGKQFGTALEDLLFDNGGKLAELVKEYGVF